MFPLGRGRIECIRSWRRGCLGIEVRRERVCCRGGAAGGFAEERFGAGVGFAGFGVGAGEGGEVGGDGWESGGKKSPGEEGPPGAPEEGGVEEHGCGEV